MRKEIKKILVSIFIAVITARSFLIPTYAIYVPGTISMASEANKTDSHKYWVIFKDGFRDNRIEMSSFNSSKGFKVIWDNDDSLYCDKQIGEASQYYYDYSSNKFKTIGEYKILSDYCTNIVASNVNVYNNSGKIIFKNNYSLLTSSDSNMLYELSDLDANYERYTGNEGDSFINKLGTRNGFTATNGKVYSSGLEIWLARYNYTREKSWVYSEYELEGKYESLTGSFVIIADCYNSKDFDTNIDFIGDGKVIKSYHITPDTKNKSVQIDISGIKKLKIYAYDNKAKCGGTSIGFVNCRLEQSGNPALETNINSANMNKGMKLQISCNLDKNELVFWSSKDESVATVSKRGVITSKKKGTTKIIGTTSLGKKAIINITVV